MALTKEQFKELWESNDEGGGITFKDITDCAKAWGISDRPTIKSIDSILNQVLLVAGCDEDATIEVKEHLEHYKNITNSYKQGGTLKPLNKKIGEY